MVPPTKLTVFCVFAVTLSFAFASESLDAQVPRVIDFESFPLGAEGVFNGSDLGDGRHTFPFEGARFSNLYNESDWGYYWEGFAISNHADYVTGSFTNQFSAYTPLSAPGNTFAIVGMDSSHFAIDGSNLSDLKLLPTLYLPTGAAIESVDLANTTYTAMTIRDGFEGFSAPFAPGDWFDVTVFGVDEFENILDVSLNFRLADYVGADATFESSVISGWTTFDLSELSGARSLHFRLNSTDVTGAYLNTPTYFAMDNIRYTAVPEPSSLAICVVVGLGAFLRRSRLNRTKVLTNQ